MKMDPPEPSAPPEEDLPPATVDVAGQGRMTFHVTKTLNGYDVEVEHDGVRHRVTSHPLSDKPDTNIYNQELDKNYTKELFKLASQHPSQEGKQECGPNHPSNDGHGFIDEAKELRRIKNRKIKKVLGWTSWITLFPVTLMINAIRDSPEDEEDLRDDPLRPWNYDVHYLYPHERS